MRLAPPLAALLLCAALAGGCGGSEDSSDSTAPAKQPQVRSQSAPAGAVAKSCKIDAKEAEQLRTTNISCAKARSLVSGWHRSASCSPPSGASRSSCKLQGAYRCLSANAGRGLSVSCARPGHSVAFIVRRD
jgi:hypothetical protein